MSGRIHGLLAHRPPFLFVDEIVERVAEVSARARWTTPDGVWPAVLLIEAIAQTGGIALGRPGLLAVIRSASVVPNPPTGRVVDLSAHIRRSRPASVEIEGYARLGTDQIGSARLTLLLTPER